MTTNTTTAPAAGSVPLGETLAEIGDTRYVRTGDAVLAIDIDEAVAAPYCPADHWALTPAYAAAERGARLDRQATMIAELRHQIDAQAAALAAKDVAISELQRRLAEALGKPAALPCPDDGRTFETSQSLKAHRGKAHAQTRRGKPTPVSDMAPLGRVLGDDGWSCPICGGSHAQSIRWPDCAEQPQEAA